MDNKFTTSLNQFRKDCDQYLCSGSFSDFLDSFGVTDVMKDYYDAFLRQCDGGKRIRAYLTYLGYGLFKGEENANKAFLPSLSYELFQTGILAHDDIIDNSDTRRFKPSMHIDLGGGHTGVSKSICAGDFGIVAALEIIAKSDFDEKTKLKAISHQNKVFISTIAGELRDIEFSGRMDVKEDEILQMNYLKTAQYTVSGPLVLGAILAEASEDDCRKLHEFGNLVGIAFQIRDDILGLFGDEEKVGKSVCADMCEGKQTVLTAHFMQNADDTQKKAFLSVYGKEASGTQQLEEVRTLITQCGSLSHAQTMCEDMVSKASRLLEETNFKAECKENLNGLLEYMTKRVS